MKLRLPNKLIAALLSTAAPALFSTLSTATLGAAAAFVVGAQANGTEVTITSSTTRISSYGAGDTLTYDLSGTSDNAYLNGGYGFTTLANIKVVDMPLNNGNSNAEYCFKGNISGSGSIGFTIRSGSNPTGMKLKFDGSQNGSMSGYSGNISTVNSDKMKLQFVSTTVGSAAAAGTITTTEGTTDFTATNVYSTAVTSPSISIGAGTTNFYGTAVTSTGTITVEGDGKIALNDVAEDAEAGVTERHTVLTANNVTLAASAAMEVNDASELTVSGTFTMNQGSTLTFNNTAERNMAGTTFAGTGGTVKVLGSGALTLTEAQVLKIANVQAGSHLNLTGLTTAADRATNFSNISGTGVITLNMSAANNGRGFNLSNFEGTIKVVGGDAVARLQMNTSTFNSQATLSLGNKADVVFNGSETQITNKIEFSGEHNIFVNNKKSGELSGSLSIAEGSEAAGVTLIKQGAGSLTLNSSLNVGKLSFKGGSIILNADATITEMKVDGGSNALTIKEGVTLHTNIFNDAWGIGTLTVNGILSADTSATWSTGLGDKNITGSGTLEMQKMIIGNRGTYVFDGTHGLKLNIGSGGITTENEHDSSVRFENGVTIGATADWNSARAIKLGNNGVVFNTSNAESADGDGNGHTITLTGALSEAAGSTGSVTKAGAGMLVLNNTNNAYTGGTHVTGGTLKTVGASLGTGDVSVDEGAKLLVDSATAVNNNLVGAGRVEYTQNFSRDFNYTGDASTFTGTMAVKRDADNHNAGIYLSDTFAGVLEVQGRFDANYISMGKAQKLVLNTDNVTNTTGFWSHVTAVTLEKNLEIIGSGTAELFTSSDVVLSGNLISASTSTLKKSNDGTLLLNGSDNTIGHLVMSGGKVQLGESAKLTFLNTLENNSSLANVTGSGTLAVSLLQGGASTATTITLDNAFTGTLEANNNLNSLSNLGGATEVKFNAGAALVFAHTVGRNDGSLTNGVDAFSKAIAIADEATFTVYTWGDNSNTNDNRISGAITGSENTTLKKADGGKLTLTGDLSGFKGAYNIAGGTLRISAESGQQKTLSGNSISGGTLAAVGAGEVILSGNKLAGGLHLSKDNEEGGALVMENVELGGRVDFDGTGSKVMKGGATTTVTNGTFSLVFNNGSLSLEKGDAAETASYDFSKSAIAINGNKTLTVKEGAALSVGGIWYGGSSQNGHLVVEDGGSVSATERVRIQSLTNDGHVSLLKGDNTERYVDKLSQGSTGKLLLGSGLELNTEKAENGTIAGSFELQSGATLNIKQLGAEVTASLKDLTLAQNATMGVYTDGTTNATAEGNISVSGTLTAESGATLNANLTFSQGAKINVAGENGLHMGSTVTFTEGNGLLLTGNASDTLAGFRLAGQSLTLFSGVDTFTAGDTSYTTETVSLNAGDYFNLADSKYDFVREHLVLKYEANTAADGGTISLWMETPEPATATLSLLALAALAARRKRK